MRLSDKEVTYKFSMWLKIRGWSISKAAIQMGVSRNYMSKVLLHKKKPSKRIVKEMCYLVHTHPVDFNTLQKI